MAELRRVDEVKAIRDKAVAMQVYAKQAKDFDLIEKATEIRIRAERRAGEILADMRRARRARQGRRRPAQRVAAGLRSPSLGVTKTEDGPAGRRLARLDEDAFELRVTAIKRQAVSPSALNKLDIRERRAEREAKLGAFQAALPQKRYGVIYADPPKPRSRPERAQIEADAKAKIEANVKAKIEVARAQIESDAKAKVRAQIEADLRAKAQLDAKPDLNSKRASAAASP